MNIGLSSVGLAIGIGVVLLGVGAFLLLRRLRGAQAVPRAAPEPVFSTTRGPSAPPASARRSPASGAVITTEALDRLAKLKSLLDDGFITGEEFQEQKTKLLGPRHD
jgi:hypothetical protein